MRRHPVSPLVAAACVLVSCARGAGDRPDSAAAHGRPSPATRPIATRDTIPWPSTPCTAAPARRTRYSLAQLDGLAGRYVLTVVAQPSPRTPKPREQSARGSLELWQPDSAHRHYDPRSPSGVGPDVRVPIIGATDVQLNALAPHALMHSPASRDPDQPGVQIWENGMVVIGNSGGPKGIGLDAGVFLSIDTLDAAHFAGRWAHGGLLDPLPHGYYCAVRIE